MPPHGPAFAKAVVGWVRRLSRGGLVSAACLALTPFGLEGQATEAACDPQLAPSPGDPLGYRLRGERCEGLYHISPVNFPGGLVVASFTEQARSIEITGQQSLVLTWQAPAPSGVQLRAVSLRRGMYYRMDARSAPGEAEFVWPTDVLAALEMNSREVGIVGWVEHEVAGRTDRVVVPIRLARDTADASVRAYSVVSTPAIELDEVYVSLVAIGPDGNVRDTLRHNQPLGSGPYSAGRPVRLTLPSPGPPGIYHLRLSGLQQGGGSASAALYFYHAGATP